MFLNVVTLALTVNFALLTSGQLLCSQNASKNCFDICVSSPGDSLSSREERCIESCAKTYVESMKAVGSALMQQ